jgi:branched-chain amino acid transport system ATP-binding protein
MLEVEALRGGYGEARVLHGVSLAVAEGEVVSLLGRNGAGKTTTLRAIMGLLPVRSGSVRLHGREIGREPPERRARAGIGYCPEERGIFASLTVAENLALLPRLGAGGLGAREIDALFPVLARRGRSAGTSLSGGEQQMLAIARILRAGARLLLLDEPSEGLAPAAVAEIGRLLRDLRARGLSILLVESNTGLATAVADRFLVMESGLIVDHVARAALAGARDRLHDYLSV